MSGPASCDAVPAKLRVDDELAAVGPVNLNNRSARLDFEIAALVFDRAFAARIAGMLEADFADSTLYETRLDEQASLLSRYGARVL